MILDWSILLRSAGPLGRGLLYTLAIVLAALALGSAIGLVVCAARRSNHGTLRGAARTYVNVFRNAPEMLLIFWAYFCLPQLVSFNISGFSTGTLALGLSSGAYLGEIFRAGVAAVPVQQWEAGTALGLRRRTLWRRIIIPQLLRHVTPLLVNYLTELLKFSTLLSAIGVPELVHTATEIGGETFRYLELYSGVAALFFFLIFPLSLYARRHGARTLARQ